MKIHSQVDSTLQAPVVVLTGERTTNIGLCESINLVEDDQRQIIAYIWKTNPALVREIVCEDCPEVC